MEVEFVPLPAERKAGYREAMRWLTKMILEEVASLDLENIRSEDRLEAAYV